MGGGGGGAILGGVINFLFFFFVCCCRCQDECSKLSKMFRFMEKFIALIQSITIMRDPSRRLATVPNDGPVCHQCFFTIHLMTSFNLSVTNFVIDD